CVEQDDKGWDARKRAYCLKIQPATGSFARNLIYSTKPHQVYIFLHFIDEINVTAMNFNDSAFCILLILINEFEFMMK
ncbi:hypothetical protein UZS05_18355, partial [Escherichia coli]|nr:hypothetical protein [Escherichia coli]